MSNQHRPFVPEGEVQSFPKRMRGHWNFEQESDTIGLVHLKIILAAEWSLADAMMGGVAFGDRVQLACSPWLPVFQPRDEWGLNKGMEEI